MNLRQSSIFPTQYLALQFITRQAACLELVSPVFLTDFFEDGNLGFGEEEAVEDHEARCSTAKGRWWRLRMWSAVFGGWVDVAAIFGVSVSGRELGGALGAFGMRRLQVTSEGDRLKLGLRGGCVRSLYEY